MDLLHMAAAFLIGSTLCAAVLGGTREADRQSEPGLALDDR